MHPFLYFAFISFPYVFTLNRADGDPLERFQVNLDLPPEERWVALASKFSQYAPQIRSSVADFIPDKWRAVILEISQNIEKYLPSPYAKEIQGVSKGLNITIGEAFLANVRYELTAFCTSIVVQDRNGVIFHARNLDYGDTSLLRSLAIDVEFVKKGKALFRGTTFVGYVGLFTGYKLGAFSLSVDQRDTGSFWLNLLRALTHTGKFVSFSIREALENEHSYVDAVTKLKGMQFIASSYMIVGGTQPGEGVVLTQGRSQNIDSWSINGTRSGWFLVETNYDHWEKPPKGDDRRDPAIKMLQSIGQVNITPKLLYSILSKYPILNKRTAYTTIMSAKEPGIYQSFLRIYNGR